MNGLLLVSEMPPVRNWPLYIYRVLAKALFFFIFGLGTLLLIFPIMPIVLLISHPLEKFQQRTRRIVCCTFKFFIAIMEFSRALKFEVPQKEFFKNLKSKIVVANHPSLLDIVMIISLIPNADVIVKGNIRNNTLLWGVVKRLYILNSLDFGELTEACKASLEKGNCLVIFPEGTRTRRTQQMRLKKGAARISFMTGTEIVAVHIGGTDKYGLGKKDPFFSFNHTEKYIYRITYQKTISPEQCKDMEVYHAVRRMNTQILEVFQNPINL